MNSKVPVGRIFTNPQEVEEADDEFYASLTPEKRMEIFFELLSYGRDYEHEIATGFPRVSQVTQLPRS